MITRWRILLASMALTGLFAGLPVFADEAELRHGWIASQALEKHIRPRYSELVNAFSKLENETLAVCQRERRLHRAALRDAFREAVLAWGQIAHITFGPMREDNRYERIFFWLDRKGIARRQVRRALREQPEDYRHARALGSKSIGVQGLSAYEQLLVSPPRVGEPRGFRCDYAAAIAGNLRIIAEAVSGAWSEGGDYARTWLSPGPDNPVYLTKLEPTFALIKAFIDSAERVRDVELLRPLGFAARNRQLPGPYARSKLTMPFVAARLDGMWSLMNDSGLTQEAIRIARAQRKQQAAEAMQEVIFELDYLKKHSAELADIPNFFEGDTGRQAISLGRPLKAVRLLTEASMSQTTKLPLGFNASDGD